MRWALAFIAAAGLAACESEAPEPDAVATEIPDELAQEGAPAPDNQPEPSETLGTPMEERLATIGLVNKRNNESQDIEMYPGEQRRIDDVIIRLAACERTAPWEDPEQTGAFVQVLVNERPSAGEAPEWMPVFSGWLFKESPSLNVVEHPVYDVWLKECAMTFPGEEDPAPAVSSDEA